MPESCDRYILVDRKPVPEPDLMKWGKWLEDNGKIIVKQDDIGVYWLSTIFIGLDMGYMRFFHHDQTVPAMVFETALFENGKLKEIVDRYATWEEAEAGHEEAKQNIQAAVNA